MSYTFLTMHSSNETVTDAEYVDIDYSAATFKSKPFITASAADNVNVFVSNITITTARLNFSQKYTGEVKYIAAATET